MKHGKSCLLLTLFFTLFLFTGCSSSAETKVIRLAILANQNSTNGEATLAFIDEIYKNTGGRYQIEPFFSGALGQDLTVIEDLQTGTIEVAVVNLSPLSNTIGELKVMDLPYIIASFEHADKIFMEGDVGKELLNLINNYGMHFLGTLELGFRGLTNSKREIKGLADIAGLRIRVMENQIQQELWAALGVDGVPMSMSEAFTAMQQGAIDGQDNSVVVSYDDRLVEITPYFALTDQVYSMSPLVLSDAFWNSLSKEDQAVFETAGYNLSVFHREITRAARADRIQRVRDEGGVCTEFSAEVKQELFAATQPVRDKYAAQFSYWLEKFESLKP